MFLMSNYDAKSVFIAKCSFLPIRESNNTEVCIFFVDVIDLFQLILHLKDHFQMPIEMYLQHFGTFGIFGSI